MPDEDLLVATGLHDAGSGPTLNGGSTGDAGGVIPTTGLSGGVMPFTSSSGAILGVYDGVFGMAGLSSCGVLSSLAWMLPEPDCESLSMDSLLSLSLLFLFVRGGV